MTTFLLINLAFAAFAISAHLWGADSRDAWNSPEWERRQHWHGFH